MRILTSMFFLTVASAPAAAQAHAHHTAAHDSAHAIVLADEQHVALHQFLLGQWTGTAAHGNAHDSIQLRFENDSAHQQLLVRHRGGLAGFEIRGDTLRWNQDVGGAACLASTQVSELLKAAQAGSARPAAINGTMTCGSTSLPFTLRKTGA